MLNVSPSEIVFPRGATRRVIESILIAVCLMLGLYGATVIYAAPEE
jgi:hypothetical protein